MVMQNSNPKTKWVNTMEMPPKINQMIFMIVDVQPVLDDVSVIFTPNGANPTIANLKHCRPNGIPIMVKQITIPPKIY